MHRLLAFRVFSADIHQMADFFRLMLSPSAAIGKLGPWSWQRRA
jgi:hypothetical protein